MNGLNLHNILKDEKSYGNILIYNTVCKTSYGEKPLHIIFDKVDGYIIKYDSTKYLALFILMKSMSECLHKKSYYVIIILLLYYYYLVIFSYYIIPRVCKTSP